MVVKGMCSERKKDKVNESAKEQVRDWGGGGGGGRNERERE